MKITGGALLAAGLLLLPAALGQAADTMSAVLHDNGREEVVGQVKLDASSHIAIVSAAPGRSGLLDKMAREMNERTTLQVLTVSQPGLPRTAHANEIIGRADSRFLDALKTELRRNHDLELR